MKLVRIGIAGCGPRGIQMGRIAQLLPEYCTLSAISDPGSGALAAGGGIFPEAKLFSSTDEMLDSGSIDAVITEIPPEVHCEYVIKALDRGIHVLGEIPAVDSLEEGDVLWEKVNGSKAIYMVGANPNYRAKTFLLKQLKAEGKLGKIAYAETQYMHNAPAVVKEGWRRSYESCRYCTHSLGPLLTVMDEEFTSVSCMSVYDQMGTGCSHNAMAALLTTPSHTVVRFLTAFGLPWKGPAHTTKITTDRGMVEVTNERARVWLKEFGAFSSPNDFIDIPLTPLPSSRPEKLAIADEEKFRLAHYGHNGCDNLMLADFCRAILEGRPSPLGIREALAMTLPGIYAAMSAREGGVLKQIRYPWDR